MTPLTVTELTSQVKSILERAFPTIWVQGELSNFKRHSSGHLYFTLKDADAQLRCVMWRRQAGRLAFTLQDGMSVLASGDVTVYEPYGQHQLVVDQLVSAGVGALGKAYEQLKQRLSDEGLTAQDRKRELPYHPKVVGVVTSPTGAAIRDILNVINRRMPSTRVILRPSQVQGQKAAEDVAQGIEDLNSQGDSEVIIVSRGGGSVEDLWAFNEEIVARAIAASAIPIVSAVGHEVDVSLADLVADVRAPTPSAGAEIVVPDVLSVINYLDSCIQTALKAAQSHLDRNTQRLDQAWDENLVNRLGRMVDEKTNAMTEAVRRLGERISRRLADSTHRAEVLGGRLEATSPLKVLARGYAAVERLPGGQRISSATQVSPGEQIALTFERDSLRALVEEVAIDLERDRERKDSKSGQE